MNLLRNKLRFVTFVLTLLSVALPVQTVQANSMMADMATDMPGGMMSHSDHAGMAASQQHSSQHDNKTMDCCDITGTGDCPMQGAGCGIGGISAISPASGHGFFRANLSVVTTPTEQTLKLALLASDPPPPRL